MRIFQLLLFISVFLMSCSNNPTTDVTTTECMELQNALNVATDNKLVALGEYVKDTNNGALCANYADALRDRIQKAQALIDAGCLPTFTQITTEQAIDEDEDELSNLGGC